MNWHSYTCYTTVPLVCDAFQFLLTHHRYQEAGEVLNQTSSVIEGYHGDKENLIRTFYLIIQVSHLLMAGQVGGGVLWWVFDQILNCLFCSLSFSISISLSSLSLSLLPFLSSTTSPLSPSFTTLRLSLTLSLSLSPSQSSPSPLLPLSSPPSLSPPLTLFHDLSLPLHLSQPSHFPPPPPPLSSSPLSIR